MNDDERERTTAYHTADAAQAEADERDDPTGPRSERIGVGGGDENVAKVQLAARWTELYAPAAGDSLDEALRRFRRAYAFIDSVSKLSPPDEL